MGARLSDSDNSTETTTLSHEARVLRRLNTQCLSLDVFDLDVQFSNAVLDWQPFCLDLISKDRIHLRAAEK